MNRLWVGTIAILLNGLVAVPAFAQSGEQCQALWEKADRNHDGILLWSEIVPYTAAISRAGIRVNEGYYDGLSITIDEFMRACFEGDFNSLLPS